METPPELSIKVKARSLNGVTPVSGESKRQSSNMSIFLIAYVRVLTRVRQLLANRLYRMTVCLFHRKSLR